MFSHRIIICLTILLLVPGFITAQQEADGINLTTHCVDRGEDWASLSKKYYTTVDELRKLNPEVENLYVGIELRVQIMTCTDKNHHYHENDISDNPNFNQDFNEAIMLMTNNDKKAQKAFTKLIKEYPTMINPTIYYYRAICSYNCGKYRAAEKDLHQALNDGFWIGEEREHAEDLLKKTKQKREEIHERNESIWSGLFVAAATTATVIAAKQQSQQPSTNSISGSGTSYSSYPTSNESVDTGTFSTSSEQSCPSLKINHGKWYCGNTGKCGMCGGDGLMNDSFGHGANSLKCTLCGGTGKCKYCQ